MLCLQEFLQHLLYLEGRGCTGVIYLTQGGWDRVVHDKVEEAQVMHLALQGPALWVPPHLEVRSLVPGGPQCIRLSSFVPGHKKHNPSPRQTGGYLKWQS